MEARRTLFFTGATGYIGSTVLSGILSHPIFPNLHITALIRDSTKAASFNSLGIHTVVGSYADHALLTREAEKADIVFTCVDAENVPAAKAILDGIKKRHAKTGTVPILIHTSGVGILVEPVDGMRSGSVAHSDMDSEYIESIPTTQLHRGVDSLNIAADKEGYIRTYTVYPGCIFGVASGKIPDLGLSRKLNFALDLVIFPAIKHRRGGMIGLGLNTWPVVDIGDLSDLYMILFTAILTNASEVAHGRDGHYFCISQDTVVLDHAKAISKALVRLGAGETEEVRSFDEEDVKSMGHVLKVWGTTVHARAERSQSIGWKPRDFNDFSERYLEEVKLRLEKI